MNIKKILLGCAAALAVVPAAHAADAIVAAEPEPAEYVRVCDAFGTGYFYIPGTETCLKIGGWVRFQVDVIDEAGANGDDYTYDAWGKAYLSVDAKSDTEMGTLQSYIGIEGDYTGRSPRTGADSAFYVDEAFLALGGFKAGYYYHWLDAGLNGETDALGDNTEFVSASYTYSSDAFFAGVAVDELGFEGLDSNNAIGVAATAGGSFGPVSVSVVGYYDTDASEGGIRGIVGADLGLGTLQVGALYNSGINGYYDNGIEWAVATAFAIKATDTLTVTPGFQYSENLAGVDDWKAGLTVDYKITEGLTTKVSAQYVDSTDDITGFFRLERSF